MQIHAALESSPGLPDAEVPRLEALNADLLRENEQLLVQLLAVQDELERYSKKVQDSLGQGPAFGPVEARATWHEADLRQAIDGENWYGAEPDGRWAGPGETSSIRIPALGGGEYELQLDIVQAISPEILPGLEVWFNGKRLETGRSSDTSPAIVSALVHSDSTATWEFRFKFPHVATPGGRDTRRLAMKLRSLRLARSTRDTREEAARAEEARQRQAFESRFWQEHQPGELAVDMRRDVDGANWHAAEPEGRWAGPGNVSTLRIPVLRRGRYELRLDIAEAMAPEIVEGMEILLNGVRLEREDRPDRLLAVACAFSTADIPRMPVWELQLRFPDAISPAVRGGHDPRNLAIYLRTVMIRDLAAPRRHDETLLLRLREAQEALRLLRGSRSTELEVDLREEVDGENWHAPEDEGRWTGPGLTSSLRMPALRDENYEVQLHVVAAAGPSLLADLILRVNRMPLEFSRSSELCPAILTARFSSDAVPAGRQWEFELQVPGPRRPPPDAEDDRRLVGLRVRTLKVFALGSLRAPA